MCLQHIAAKRRVAPWNRRCGLEMLSRTRRPLHSYLCEARAEFAGATRARGLTIRAPLIAPTQYGTSWTARATPNRSPAVPVVGSHIRAVVCSAGAVR